MKKILIINANPKSDSLCHSFATQYRQSLNERHEAISVNISELRFEIDLHQGYEEKQILEPDLVTLQERIQWANHIVIVTPVWWGGIPAKFKGVIDRVLLPGFAFQYEAGKSVPKKLLKGKTSELFITLDTPIYWYKWIQGNPIHKQLTHTILGFAGIKNLSTRYFGPVINSTAAQRDKWLNKVSEQAKSL